MDREGSYKDTIHMGYYLSANKKIKPTKYFIVWGCKLVVWFNLWCNWKILIYWTFWLQGEGISKSSPASFLFCLFLESTKERKNVKENDFFMFGYPMKTIKKSNINKIT